MNVWELTQEGYDPERAEENGNRFLTGNGFVGVRGTLDEDKKDRLVAWNLAGVYDRHGDNLWREPVNAPNGFFAELIGAGKVLQHVQRLDLYRALQSRETEYEHAFLLIERFASQHDAHLLCQRITIRPKAGTLTLRCGIDGDVWDLNGPHLFEHHCGETTACCLWIASRASKGCPSSSARRSPARQTPSRPRKWRISRLYHP
jgi:kojibiose phosphorylase/nigerose phosphorylase